MTAAAGVTSAGARILDILCEVTGDGEVATDLDVELYGSGLLDSLGIVTLLVSFEQVLGLTISPTDLDREAWATPRRLVADVERRLAAAGPAR
jgi:D-alanine--poly(phosphoribitol) ligase subunit 2